MLRTGEPSVMFGGFRGAQLRSSGVTYWNVGPAVFSSPSRVCSRLCAFPLSMYIVPIEAPSACGTPLNVCSNC